MMEAIRPGAWFVAGNLLCGSMVWGCLYLFGLERNASVAVIKNVAVNGNTSAQVCGQPVVSSSHFRTQGCANPAWEARRNAKNRRAGHCQSVSSHVVCNSQ
jgi:hypothetical protein